MPHADGGTIVWEHNIEHADKYFGYYEAAIDASLRFPLHPAVKDILAGYRLGLWQLTPNSWVNILGFVAACEMQGVTPGFEVFANMHYLSQAPKSDGGWYTLTTHLEFMMTLSKPSKWRNWRHRFYYISSSNRAENLEFNSWNDCPPLLSKKALLPIVPTEGWKEILDPNLFGV